MREPDSNIGRICNQCAPRPGRYAKTEPAEFLGKLVKVAFPTHDSRWIHENMWVLIDEISGSELGGVLNNDPHCVAGLKCGDRVQVKPEAVLEVL